MILRWLPLLAWLTFGCSSSKQMAPAGAGAEYAYGMSEIQTAGRGDAPAPSMPADSRAMKAAVMSPPPPPPPPTQIRPTPPTAAARMVHYDGWVRMRVTQPSDTVDAIAALATAAGGRVDRLTDQAVTIRVPVDQFEATWAAILALGDVMDKRVRADDITEQFLAVDLRVRTLRTMRDRLVKLLGRASSEEEKLALLQQITRVTEELDATESRLRTLKDLAAMSSITVEAVPREAFGGSSSGMVYDGFGWIGSLSPFNRGVVDDEKRIALEAPHEMVPLSNRGPFIAESADGTVLWTLRVHNDPVGSGDFWVAAIEERIGKEFADVTRKALGEWSCLMLHEPGAEEPYRWDVCVAKDGPRSLKIAQAFYPAPPQVVRFAERIAFALDKQGGES